MIGVLSAPDEIESTVATVHAAFEAPPIRTYVPVLVKTSGSPHP